MFDQDLYFGVAYYPELWNDEVIAQDIKYFKELGINCVRIAEFAWSVMEPQKDKFDFSLFIKIIKILAENNIKVILGTPTVTPPIWLSENNPDGYHVTENGEKLYHGIREHCCLNNDYYQERSKIIIGEMVKALDVFENVIGYQIHNEFCWPVRECFCKTCVKKWSTYLKNKYHSIENLNQLWGTRMWSQTYDTFENVVPPKNLLNDSYGMYPNPCLKTEYIYYSHSIVADFIKRSCEKIRNISHKPITTNVNRVFYLNFYETFKNLDFVSFDEYAGQDQYQEFVINHDLWRNLKEGAPFWLMETAVSHGGSVMGTSGAHRKGYVQSEALSTFFAGAKAFCFWVFRQQRTGMEQLHGHIISSFGKPSAYFSNALDVRHVMNENKNFLLHTAIQKAEIAFVYSDQARAMFFSGNFGESDYYTKTMDHYKILLRTGAYRDIVFEDCDLSEYKFIYIPNLLHISKNMRVKIKAAFNRGATVFFSELTGIRDEYCAVNTDCALSDMETLCGVSVKYVTTLSGQDAYTLIGGEKILLDGYSIIFKQDASSVGQIYGGYCDQDTILLEKPVGLGKAVFCGNKLNDSAMQKLISKYIEELNIPTFEISNGVVRYDRTDGEKTYYCFINMLNTVANIKCKEEYRDILSNESYKTFELQPNEKLILGKND